MLRCKAYYRQARNAAVHCTCPALLLRGAHDGIVAAEDSAALASALGARCVPLESSGHVPMLEEPSKVAELIEDFAREL